MSEPQVDNGEVQWTSVGGEEKTSRAQRPDDDRITAITEGCLIRIQFKV